MTRGKNLAARNLDHVERLVEESMPELLDFFEEQRLPLQRIDRIFFDALYRLAHRWDTIQDHRSWLLKTLERLAREEPADERRPVDEEGPDEDPGASDGTAPV